MIRAKIVKQLHHKDYQANITFDGCDTYEAVIGAIRAYRGNSLEDAVECCQNEFKRLDFLKSQLRAANRKNNV